jgi:hypothetical protein
MSAGSEPETYVAAERRGDADLTDLLPSSALIRAFPHFFESGQIPESTLF